METPSSSVQPRAQRARAPPTWMRGEEYATPADLAQARRREKDGSGRKHNSHRKSREQRREDDRARQARHRYSEGAAEARRQQRRESTTEADREARRQLQRESVTQAEREMMDALEAWDGYGALPPQLRLAANLLATRHRRAALIKWAMDSGFDQFTPLIAALPRSDDPEALASPQGQAAIAALIALIKSITPSHAQIETAIGLYKGSMDHDSLHQLTCGACGVRSYVNMRAANLSYPYYDIGDDLMRLRLSDEQVQEYLAVDEQYP